MKKKFMLVFDIPRKLNTLRNRVHRRLVKFNVEKVQDSVWASNDVNLLLDTAKEIKKEGASAQVFRTEKVM
jgi:CRISPR/Cas system-associated endoribonuclease Cas2